MIPLTDIYLPPDASTGRPPTPVHTASLPPWSIPLPMRLPVPISSLCKRCLCQYLCRVPVGITTAGEPLRLFSCLSQRVF